MVRLAFRVFCLALAACGSAASQQPPNFEPQNAPVRVVGPANFIALATGTGHTCGVREGGATACWGWNLYGQLGTGTSGDFRGAPVTVSALSGVRALAAGNEHTCVLHTDATVSCWGRNDFGQLGDGTAGSQAFRTSPVRVPGLSGVQSLAAGGYTTCALMVGGAVRCWGLNSFGQVGDGALGAGQNRSTPTPVVGLTDATALSVGSSHACAVRAAGTVSCWGLNGFGQLGDGSTENRATPVALAGQVSVAGVSAGGGHTCIVGSGVARCLGANNSGQLGAGLPVGASPIVPVVDLTTVESLSAGSAHTCAVLRDRTVRCWGAGADGQLGSGTSANSSVPRVVVGLTGVSIVSAGGGHTCALRSDKSAACWGRNNYGQLGWQP